MAQHAGKSTHNGEAEPDAGRVAGAGLTALKLDEDGLELGFPDPRAGVVHLDTDIVALLRHPISTVPRCV